MNETELMQKVLDLCDGDVEEASAIIARSFCEALVRAAIPLPCDNGGRDG